jgi:large subunit ribosomal protein L19
MQSVIQKIESRYKKNSTVEVRSGDNVRVHQRIIEAGKERIQIFEGLVIRVSRQNSLSHSFTVRRIASGVGVEKTFLAHSPNISKIEITKRSKVRRNYLTYMRGLTGKSARLAGVGFDKEAVNRVEEPKETPITEAASQDSSEVAIVSEHDAKSQSDKVKTAEKEKQESEAEKIEEKPVERAGAKAPVEVQNKQK